MSGLNLEGVCRRRSYPEVIMKDRSEAEERKCQIRGCCGPVMVHSGECAAPSPAARPVAQAHRKL